MPVFAKPEPRGRSEDASFLKRDAELSMLNSEPSSGGLFRGRSEDASLLASSP